MNWRDERASFDAGLLELAARVDQLERGEPPPYGRTAIAELRDLYEDLALIDVVGYRCDVDATRRHRITELVERLRRLETSEAAP